MLTVKYIVYSVASADLDRIDLKYIKFLQRIAYMLFRSAGKKPLDFTRENVYNFCVKLDGSVRMKAAAQCVLDENRLPSHSAVYREAYSPAYRVLHMDYIRLRAKRDEDPEDEDGTDTGE